MGPNKNFEDLIAWQKGHYLILEIFKTLNKKIDESDNALFYEMKRSAIGICSNIATGYDQNSDKHMIYFLNIAKGFAAELRSQIILARDLNFFSSDKASILYALSLEVSKILSGLISSLCNTIGIQK